jgi:hypothetical protein
MSILFANNTNLNNNLTYLKVRLIIDKKKRSTFYIYTIGVRPSFFLMGTLPVLYCKNRKTKYVNNNMSAVNTRLACR